MPPRFILESGPDQVSAPALDAEQLSVVQHRGGPLLVLAGPGTGKTSTVVEAVVDRINSGELRPDQILVLTFSRKAAEELRSRISARMPGTTVPVPSMTFHSFCYGLVREFAADESYSDPPTLMTAAEQEAVIHELLAGTDIGSWPESLRPAVPTRGFSAELQSFMGQLAGRDISVIEFGRIAAQSGRPDWIRVAAALKEYLEVADAQNLSDYADVVARAAAIAAKRDVTEVLRARYQLVIVDEFQDTDPQQVRLLHHLAADGRDLIVVGDHDQAIYGFRGADTRGIEQFAEQFSVPGTAVKVVALRTTRRFGARILAASQQIIGATGQPGRIDPAVLQQHRQLASAAPTEGDVSVQTFGSSFAESEFLVDRIQRLRIDNNANWSDFALLVRTGEDLLRYQRPLIAAGIPVEYVGNDLPLSAEPAVRTILSALDAAVQLSRAEKLDPAQANALLVGPLGKLDAVALRRIGRMLRRLDRDKPSEQLIADALSEPTFAISDDLDGSTRPHWQALRQLAEVLHGAARRVLSGHSVEEVLWHLWSATSWPGRLRKEWEQGGQTRFHADRDLDALCALFHQAARQEERRQHMSAENFLADIRAQTLPVDDIAKGESRPDAVQLMTAHRSKGLEWPYVLIAGAQEGVWPNLAVRGSLLKPELLDGAAGTDRREIARQERRLFYVAMTRARESVTITAVESASGEELQPSRFISELRDAGIGTEAGVAPHGRLRRQLSLRSIIAQARRIALHNSDELRAQAVDLLAEIAEHQLPATRSANPHNWWSTRELTHNDEPIRPADQPVQLSASQLSALTSCSLRWFLDREVRASTPSTQAQGLGLVIHVLAAALAQPRSQPIGLAELRALLDETWPRLTFAAPWISVRERLEADQLLVRLVRWHDANRRTVLATEFGFDLAANIGEDQVRLSGSMDRVELGADGRVHVVDFKTGKNTLSKADVAEDPQLGLYQFVVNAGALDQIAPGSRAGGSELVFLAKPAGTKSPDAPYIQPQDALADQEPTFVDEQLEQAVEIVRTENVAATPETCKSCSFVTVCPAKTSFLVEGG